MSKQEAICYGKSEIALCYSSMFVMTKENPKTTEDQQHVLAKHPAIKLHFIITS